MLGATLGFEQTAGFSHGDSCIDCAATGADHSGHVCECFHSVLQACNSFIKDALRKAVAEVQVLCKIFS